MVESGQEQIERRGGRMRVTDPPQAEINGKDIWESYSRWQRARLYTTMAGAICDGSARAQI